LGQLLQDPVQRFRMSEHGRALVDGKGVDRVATVLRERFSAQAA
jgi:hypothetical protein